WQSSSDSGATWQNIAGQTTQSYTVVEADETHLLRIEATSSNPDGSGLVKDSAATLAVADVEQTLATPLLSALAKECPQLTAPAAVSTLFPYTTLFRSWQSSSDSGATWQNIAGQTTQSYTVVEADETNLLRIEATSSNPDGSGLVKDSVATLAV